MTEEEIFTAALQEPPENRAAYLDRTCGQDQALRQRVEKLLSAHAHEDSFMVEAELTADTRAYRAQTEDVGTTIGPYKLLQKLGEGGMGTVWIAEREHPKQRVALKLIKPGMDSKQIIRRFDAERQALALMSHNNIAKMLDAGTTESGRPYFVMELVKGVPITKYCDETHASIQERLKLFIPVCLAVQHAHQKGIIHRDIKPSNVLVCIEDGKPVPKVIDFGVAKALHQPLTEGTLHTAFNQIVGTLEYMSPEQAELNALDIDTRADIYALGVLLFELLTGSTPITRDELKQVAVVGMLRKIKEVEPRKPSTRLSESKETIASLAALRRTDPSKLMKEVRGDLDWIVLKCLEADRTRRYETANALGREIERHLANESVEACPPSMSYRLWKFVRRNRSAVLAAALVFFAVITGMVSTIWQAARADQQRLLSEDNAQKAHTAEELANQRLTQVNAQMKRADQERANASSISFFLEHDILGQVDRRQQNLQGFRYDPDLKVRTAIDRAAANIGNSFTQRPLAEASIRRTIGQSYVSLGLPELALSHLERSRTIYEATLGKVHPDTIESIMHLGNACLAAKNIELGISLHEEYYQRNREKWGPLSPWTTGAMNYLGNLYLSHDKIDKALAIFEQIVTLRKEESGPSHPNTLWAIYNLAEAKAKLGKAPEAIELIHQILAVVHKQFPIDDFYRFLSQVGELLLKVNASAEAEPILRQVLTFEERTRPDFWNRFRIKALLGGAFLGQKKYAEAEQFLLEGFEGMKRAGLGISVTETAARLVQLYKETGRKEQIEVWEKKLAESRVAEKEGNYAFYQSLKNGKISANYSDVGKLLAARGMVAEAEAEYRRAIASYKQLAADVLAKPRQQGELADLHYNLGKLLASQGRRPEAEGEYRQALTIQEKLEARAAEIPASGIYDVAPQFYHNMAMSLAQLGQTGRATVVAETRIAKQTPNRTLDSLYDCACVFSLCSAACKEDKEREKQYADRAMALLITAVVAGYKNLDQIKKETDFTALHSRDDFKKLVVELEKKVEQQRQSEPIDQANEKRQIYQGKK